ncbi:hypothetical protein LguiB_017159 [Lonicera macranthoides]
MKTALNILVTRLSSQKADLRTISLWKKDLEKRAFLFCQQDRAILCRDCDFSIHKANEHTQSHSRFLLTGIKLSPTSTLYSPAPSASPTASSTDVVPQKTLSDQIFIANNSTISRDDEKLGVKSSSNNEMMNGGGGSNGSTSSISEYLIDTLPGWHVEDFLDASSTPFGFYKSGENDVLPFWEGDVEGNNISSLSSENMGVWVPQAPPPMLHQSYPVSIMVSGGMINFKESKETVNKKIKYNTRKWRDDGGFTVPQITSPTSTTNKRSRTLW